MKLTLDSQGIVNQVDVQIVRALDCKISDVIGHLFDKLIDPIVPKEVLTDLHETVRLGQVFSMNLRFRPKETSVWFEVDATKHYENGLVAGTVIHFKAIEPSDSLITLKIFKDILINDYVIQRGWLYSPEEYLNYKINTSSSSYDKK